VGGTTWLKVAIVGGMLAFASPNQNFWGGRVPPVPPIIAAPDQQSTVEFSILTKWQWKMKIYFGYVELANKRPDY